MRNINIENIADFFFKESTVVDDIISATTLTKFKKLNLDFNSEEVLGVFRRANSENKKKRTILERNLGSTFDNIRAVRSHADFI